MLWELREGECEKRGEGGKRAVNEMYSENEREKRGRETRGSVRGRNKMQERV